MDEEANYTVTETADLTPPLAGTPMQLDRRAQLGLAAAWCTIHIHAASVMTPSASPG